MPSFAATNQTTTCLAPGPHGRPLIGDAVTFGRDPRAAILGWVGQFGPIVRFKVGPMVVHIIADPDAVKHVLVTNNDNYHKAPRMGFLADFLGQSLLTMEGGTWLRRRRLAQPAFHKERLAELADAMTAGAHRLVERLAPRADSGRSFDVHAEMMRLTLGVAGETLFGVDLSTRAEEVGRALPVILEHVLGRLNAVLPLPLWVPTQGNRRYHAAVRTLDALVLDMIRDFRSGRTRPRGLMAQLMEARDADTGAGLTDDQLRDEVMTLIFAGHETTASALTWTWWLLAQNPACAARLRDELVRVLGDRAPTAADLPHLQYTTNTVLEAMRLMPPSWGIARMPLTDDVVGGYLVPRGSLVILAACATHRDPRHWEAPDTFDPDRFTPERSQSRHKLAYYPFSAGPRVCIGSNFSMMEATLVVATLMQKYRLELDPICEVEIEASLTLRPKRGLWMTFHPVPSPAARAEPAAAAARAPAPEVAPSRCPFAFRSGTTAA
jgi:cytochrome P450